MRGWSGVLLCVIAAGTLAAQNPVIVDNGVLNGASFAKGQPVAPGSLVSIFGDNLATTLASASSVPFSTSLGGVTVSVGGVPAPLRDAIPGTASSRSQINAQIPWEALQGEQPASVGVIVTNGGASPSQQLQITPVAPGIFTIPPGVGNAIAINPDGSIAAPDGSIPGYPTRPAKRGDGVFFYATGLGAVTPAVADGADSLDQLRKTLASFTVVVDGIPVTPFFTGLSPQFPGVNQINFTVPNGAHSGLVALQIQTADGTLYPPNSTTPPVVMAIE